MWLIEPDLMLECTQVGRIEKFFSQVTASAKVFLLHHTRHGPNKPPSSLKLV